jgi:enterochelin esterase-like enzyme
MKNALLLICLFLLLVSLKSGNPLPKVISGRLQRLENFPSKYVSSRNIDVWLPANYNDTVKHAVLYMHDGQMLFDPEQTWNHQAWNVDDVASTLQSQHQTQAFIVVGIWNSGSTRHQEYFPQKPFEKLTDLEKDSVFFRLKKAGKCKDTFLPQSDLYLQFLVEELIPYIDYHFAVRHDRQSTFMAGSSMGGLISIYGLCEYPEIFGGVACLSSHWPGTYSLENNPLPNAFLNYLDEKLPPPGQHKIYFDCGDQTLDALYPALQKRVDSLLIEKKYTLINQLSYYSPGDEHNEVAWNKRLPGALKFLIGK